MSPNELPPRRTVAERRSLHHGTQSAEYLLSPEKALIIVKFGKKLTVQDFGRYAILLHANPSFQPVFSEIGTWPMGKRLSLRADRFLRLGDQIDPFSPDAKRASVAQTPAQSHTVRTHEILRTQRNIEVFRTIEEAEAKDY